MPLQIVRVAPLGRGALLDELTYFSAQPLLPGTIVTVPLRRRLVSALVLGVRAAGELKAAVKDADYPLTKVKAVKCAQFFLPQFLAATEWASRWFAAPLGTVIKSLVPQAVLDHCAELNLPLPEEGPERYPVHTKPEKLSLQDAPAERLTFYKSLIRQEFARQMSVFLCEPTLLDLLQMQEALGRGIQEYTVLLHPQLGQKTLLAEWQRALRTPHPLLIIATPLFLSLPRTDIKTIILDNEGSSAYKNFHRPLVDFRAFGEALAERLGARLLVGDTLLRTETLHRTSAKEWQPAASLKQRLVSTAKTQVVQTEGGEIFSEEAKEILTAAIRHHERSFVLCPRRGLAPLVVCDDCGQLVLCANCQAPVVLHQRGVKQGIRETNVFMCHHCGLRRDSAEKCANCRGWRLKELGVGLEKIASELASLYPKLPVWPLSSDTATPRRAAAMVKKFLQGGSGVLVGTGLALGHLRAKIENCLAIGLDSLLALPDFRIQEKVFRLLILSRTLAGKNFLIQTRNRALPLWHLAAKGNLIDFYRLELADRREVGYPPFRLLVQISRRGREAEVKTDMAALGKRLADYQPAIFPALASEVKSQYHIKLLIKLPPERWPDDGLLAILTALPPEFVVAVDPETIL